MKNNLTYFNFRNETYRLQCTWHRQRESYIGSWTIKLIAHYYMAPHQAHATPGPATGLVSAGK